MWCIELRVSQDKGALAAVNARMHILGITTSSLRALIEVPVLNRGLVVCDRLGFDMRESRPFFWLASSGPIWKGKSPLLPGPWHHFGSFYCCLVAYDV